jgi:hypothetical protein
MGTAPVREPFLPRQPCYRIPDAQPGAELRARYESISEQPIRMPAQDFPAWLGELDCREQVRSLRAEQRRER